LEDVHEVVIGDGDVPAHDALGDGALGVVLFVSEGEHAALFDGLDEGLSVVAAEFGGEDAFEALTDLGAEIGGRVKMAEVVGEIKAVEALPGGPGVDALVEGEALEEVIAVAAGEEVLDAEFAQLRSESEEVVASDAAHAGGDADAQGSVIAIVVKRAFNGYELDASGPGDGAGDAEFEVFLVVEGEAEESLAVRSGTKDGAGIEAATEGDGGFAEQGQGAFGDGLPEGGGEFFGDLFGFLGRLGLRLKLKVDPGLFGHGRVVWQRKDGGAGVWEGPYLPVIGKGGGKLAGKNEFGEGSQVPVAALASEVSEGVRVGAVEEPSGRVAPKGREEAPAVSDKEELSRRAVKQGDDEIAA
jgi:hypothetical protein